MNSMKKYTIVAILASALVPVGSFCAMREAAKPAHVVDAIIAGNCEIVQTCLDAKTDVGQVDKYGRSLLWYAAEHGQAGIAGLLLERGAKMSVSDKGFGHFPIHRAANGGYTDTVRLLLDSNAEVNQKSTRNWGTPLHDAARNGNSATVKFLLERNADVNQMNSCLEGPLFGAARSADFAIDTRKDYSGRGDVLVADKINDRINIVRLLIVAGADYHQRNDIGFTPLRMASPAIQEVIRAASVAPRAQEVEENKE